MRSIMKTNIAKRWQYYKGIRRACGFIEQSRRENGAVSEEFQEAKLNIRARYNGSILQVLILAKYLLIFRGL